MTWDILRRLRQTGLEQLTAVRDGSLPRLETLERRRRGLIEELGGSDLAACGASDPDGFALLMREILEAERLVRTALHGRLEEKRVSLAQIDKRLSAQTAYRRMGA